MYSSVSSQTELEAANDLYVSDVSTIYPEQLVESEIFTKTRVKEFSIEQRCCPVIIETNDLMRLRYPSNPCSSLPLVGASFDFVYIRGHYSDKISSLVRY